MTLNLLVLGWLLWDINESLAIVIEKILTLSILLLVLIVVVVSQGVLVVVASAVHFESNAFVDKHLVLTLSWELEAFVREDDVFPDLRHANLLQVEELVGIVIFISLVSIIFTELKSE